MFDFIVSAVNRFTTWVQSLIINPTIAENINHFPVTDSTVVENFNHLKSKISELNPKDAKGYDGVVWAVRNCQSATLNRLLQDPDIVKQITARGNAILDYAKLQKKLYLRYNGIVQSLQNVPAISNYSANTRKKI